MWLVRGQQKKKVPRTKCNGSHKTTRTYLVENFGRGQKVLQKGKVFHLKTENKNEILYEQRWYLRQISVCQGRVGLKDVEVSYRQFERMNQQYKICGVFHEFTCYQLMDKPGTPNTRCPSCGKVRCVAGMPGDHFGSINSVQLWSLWITLDHFGWLKC